MSCHASRMPATLTTQPVTGAKLPTLAPLCSSGFIYPVTQDCLYRVTSSGCSGPYACSCTFHSVSQWCYITLASSLLWLQIRTLGVLSALMVLASRLITYWQFSVPKPISEHLARNFPFVAHHYLMTS